jgi:hypothetical protein
VQQGLGLKAIVAFVAWKEKANIISLQLAAMLGAKPLKNKAKKSNL